MEKIDPDILNVLRKRGGTWAAYENQAMDSQMVGHLQFLKVGEGCTYQSPPPKYPVDNSYGMGWRYLFVGLVDLETGEINVNSPTERAC